MRELKRRITTESMSLLEASIEEACAKLQEAADICLSISDSDEVSQDTSDDWYDLYEEIRSLSNKVADTWVVPKHG